MGLGQIAFTTALAKLLSDPRWLEAYKSDRRNTARQLDLADSDLNAFLSLNENLLTQQAASLLNKRFHEVSQIACFTVRMLGQRARALFTEFAPSSWPEGHRRHLADAAEFCRYLKRTRQDFCRAELNYLEFLLSKRRLSVRLVRDFYVHNRPRFAVQVLYRKNSEPRQFVWFSRYGMDRELPKSSGKVRPKSANSPPRN